METRDICYCHSSSKDPDMITCALCKKQFHRTCLKSGPPSALAGDVYFKFWCTNCSATQEEVVERIKLQWVVVILLAIYNLQLQGSGKCGFFRWREDICRFIDKNWNVFFGMDKKKAATWHHTIAGVMSTNCNKYFLSGAEQLGEKGWWALKNQTLPSIEELENIQATNKALRKGRLPLTLDPMSIIEGSRQRNTTKNILEAALALKAKRTTGETFEGPPKNPKRKKMDENIELKITLSNHFNDVNSLPSTAFEAPLILKSELVDNIAENVEISAPEFDLNSLSIKQETVDQNFKTTEQDYSSLQCQAEIESMKQWLQQDSSNSSIPTINFDDESSHFTSESLDTLFDDLLNDIDEEPQAKALKKENKVSETISSTPLASSKAQLPDAGRKRKVITKEEPSMVDVCDSPRYFPMSSYDEQNLLTQLQERMPAILQSVQARNLYRKLTVRKIKRDRNLPVFDLDDLVRKACGIKPTLFGSRSNPEHSGRQEILDRFQTIQSTIKGSTSHRGSFFSRLMGLSDEHQNIVISSYTTRILKPYIYRDYETETPRLKLLREIVSYPHRNDPMWKPPLSYPIDYSYVRAQYIPAVNSLCHEFFWPGIDMSECLQYPDFSCVALYRKIVIGFAFMVPDVNINEAYITFLFSHPHWRKCGIATNMLYHLIQTCMGKDITLHVSANSPAVPLYQKLGFKIEELILDFYDKYLPSNSKECRHAYFLRLNR